MKGIPILVFIAICSIPSLVLAQGTDPDSLRNDTVIVPVKSGQGKGVASDTGGNIRVNDYHPEIAGPDTSGKKTPTATKYEKEKEPSGTRTGDTLAIKKHNPKTAAWMSAAIPGLGQIYNRKYWKLPVVYVGLGVCGYFVWTNTSEYRKYKETYRYRMGVDSMATDYFPNATDNTVKEMKEYHHKNIEISYIAAGLIYLLNIIDATVDAHLYDFDITDDLTMRIEPGINAPMQGFGGNSTAGVKLTLRF